MGAVGRYFTPRCVGMHATLLILLPAFAWLTWWQLSRALDGNTLSWAYTFEWPLFAGYAVYVWWQLIHDQTTAVSRRVLPASNVEGAEGDHSQPGWALTGGRKKNVAIAAESAVVGTARSHGERYAEQTADEAERLAAYNRYLAELNAADASPARRAVEGAPPAAAPRGRHLGAGARSGGPVHGALIRYRVMAFVVGTALLVLTAIVIAQVCGAHVKAEADIVAPIHGYLYILYLITAADLARRAHWKLGRILAVVAAGFVPTLAFFVEHGVYQQMQTEFAAEAAGAEGSMHGSVAADPGPPRGRD